MRRNFRSNRLPLVLLLAGLLGLPAGLDAALRAGVARTRITPDTPAWLVGFAARTRPATEIGLDLYAKALALEVSGSRTPSRAVLVTADLIGFTRRVSDELARRALAKHKLRRDQLFLFASHTHSGPALLDGMTISVGQGAEFDQAAERYTSRLIDQLDTLIDQAISKLAPAKISSGWTEAGFAFNRRTEHLAQIRPGESFPAPVDPRVPVIRVDTEIGQPIAHLFGYACHPTVLTGDTYEISGDYPGYAQQAIEQLVPGTTAMFLQLAAGDQRARPRGTRKLAQTHGQSLAEAVLKTKLTPLAQSLATTLDEVQLPFVAHTREIYQAEAQSADIFAARRGKRMLSSEPAPLKAEYPVQGLRIGTLSLLALPGEVVVDYALDLKSKFGNRVILAAYATYLPGYIPTRRIQREGGYEAGDSMMYFLQPGWFSDEVEELVKKQMLRVIQRLGSNAGSPASPSPSRAR